MPVRMDPTKAGRSGEGRKSFNIRQTAGGCLGQHVGRDRYRAAKRPLYLCIFRSKLTPHSDHPDPLFRAS
jgi:hypothetical protein